MDKVFYVLATVAVLLVLRLLRQRQLMSALADTLLLSLTLITLTMSLGAPMAGLVTLVLYCTGILLVIFVAGVSIQTLSPTRFEQLSEGFSHVIGTVSGDLGTDTDNNTNIKEHAPTVRAWLLPAILAGILLVCMWWLIGRAQLGEVTQGVTAQAVGQHMGAAYVLLGQITLLWLVVSLCWLYQYVKYIQPQLYGEQCEQSFESKAVEPDDDSAVSATTVSGDTANAEASS